MAKEKVVVAMSGGVDSCAAAAILQDQGYQVIGMTMQLWNHGVDDDERFDSCCSLSDVHDARRVCHKLGIPHYVVNYEKNFKRDVVDYFASEYEKGRTPNPCVKCNSQLKFDHLIERAAALGVEKVATGHYVQKTFDREGRLALSKGIDHRKDQSYFLFEMDPGVLKNVLFPLGGLTKAEVRDIAGRYGLHTAQKHESQEICFVTGKRYTDFLDEHYPALKEQKGDIVDEQGHVLGRHEGIYQFTVGQRKGLGFLNAGERLYVSKIDADTNQVTVSSQPHFGIVSFFVDRLNLFVPMNELSHFDLTVVARYHSKPFPCRVRLVGGRPQIVLEESARWVTPGQAAVLYAGERLIGGGFVSSEGIQRSETDERNLDERSNAAIGSLEKPVESFS